MINDLLQSLLFEIIGITYSFLNPAKKSGSSEYSNGARFRKTAGFRLEP